MLQVLIVSFELSRASAPQYQIEVENVKCKQIFIWWMAAGFHVESELQTFEVFWGFLSVDYNQITMIQISSFRPKTKIVS